MTFQPLTALGLMSGTSMDGVDLAILKTDGEGYLSFGVDAVYPYTEELRILLQALLSDPDKAERDPLGDLEHQLNLTFIEAIETFLKAHNLAINQIDLIGLHGQTVFHKPSLGITRQLGCGATLAQYFKTKVVNDFRSADVAAGGEGAPLAPLFHAALAINCPHPMAIVNLGGISNMTYIDGTDLIAFDCGPASALIDDYVRRYCHANYDDGGGLAFQGKADEDLVAEVMAWPYFQKLPPKSLDRQAFHNILHQLDHLSACDAVATLSVITVDCLIAACRHLPSLPKQWVLTGGGRHNDFICEKLAERSNIPVIPIEDIGFCGDTLEAACFAYLAVRSYRKLPLSLPSTTGVRQPLSGGIVSFPLT